MLPKNTPKIQLSYPKSFDCFADVRCYSTKYMQFFSSFYNDREKDRLIADAKKFHRRYICEMTYLDTGAGLQFTCNDARRPARYVKLSESDFANVVCVLFNVEE